MVGSLASGEAPALTRARHRLALEDLRRGSGRAERADLPELLTEDLRLASRALGRITGRVDVEEVLDAIFREFCIGKYDLKKAASPEGERGQCAIRLRVWPLEPEPEGRHNPNRRPSSVNLQIRN